MPTSPAPSPSLPPSSNRILGGVLALLILILAVGAMAVRLSGFSLTPQPTPGPISQEPIPTKPPDYPFIPSEPTASSTASSTLPSEYMNGMTPRLISLQERRRDVEEERQRSGEKIETQIINVSWQKPVKVSSSTVLGDVIPEGTIPVVAGPYLRGEVSDGPLKGARVYTGEILCDGMCPEATTLQVWVVAGDKRLAIEGYYYPNLRYVPYGSDLLANAFGLPTHKEDGTHFAYILSRPNVPKLQDLANGRTVLVDQEADGTINEYGRLSSSCWTDGCPGYRSVTTTKQGFVVYERTESYSDQKVIFTEDGAMHTVLSAVPFDAYDIARYRPIITTATLKWSGAYATNTSQYIRYYLGGCGGMQMDNVMTTKEIKNNDLVLAGKTAQGEPIYTIVDPYAQNPETQKAYDNWFFYNEAGGKPTLEEFLQQHPVPFFIWKNAFGENIRYVLSDGVVPAECGKPVIYLYPETTSQIHVKLDPKINVTVSEPTYPQAGWTVTAHPDGQLIYKGKSYGSLFWEGTGVSYDIPSEGFVLKDGDVDTQLKTILARYGLNERESQEFRDFWVPLMTGSPYYRASFVTTQAWNKAAPLSVTPKPTTVLRIFMDWEKLSAPITLQEPAIQAPTRTGFTLVEWGGLLRK